MKLHEFEIQFNNKKKRVGRGFGSGKGKTAGRGTKGQKSRSGVKLRPGFEGGQTPLVRRIPKKKGFKSRSRDIQIVNVSDLEKLKTGIKVTKEILFKEKIISNSKEDVKILGKGELKKKLIVNIPNVSKNAQEKIKKAGGEILNKKEEEKKKTLRETKKDN